DLGVAELHLVAFAAHRLDEDAELELAASEDGERVGRVRVLELEREVLACLADETFTELAAREELRLLALARQRRRVHADAHLDRRLLDDDAGERAPLPALGEVGDRVADVDVVDPG